MTVCIRTRANVIKYTVWRTRSCPSFSGPSSISASHAAKSKAGAGTAGGAAAATNGKAGAAGAATKGKPRSTASTGTPTEDAIVEGLDHVSSWAKCTCQAGGSWADGCAKPNSTALEPKRIRNVLTLDTTMMIRRRRVKNPWPSLATSQSDGMQLPHIEAPVRPHGPHTQNGKLGSISPF